MSQLKDELKSVLQDNAVIKGHTIERAATSSDIEVLWLLRELTMKRWSDIALSLHAMCIRSVVSYYFKCIEEGEEFLESQRDVDIHSRFDALRDLCSCYNHWNAIGEKGDAYKKYFTVELGNLYLRLDSSGRDAIIIGFLEHTVAFPSFAADFESWRRNDILNCAIEEAMRLSDVDDVRFRPL